MSAAPASAAVGAPEEPVGGGALADIWLLTMCVTLLAAAWPWLTHAVDIDFAALAWGSLALAAFTAALVAHSIRAAPRGERWVATLIHLAGIGVLGYVWHHAGGLQNPAFLLAFALPILGSTALGRAQVYAAAALSILVFAVVALSEAPEFRWYVARSGPLGTWIAERFAHDPAGGSESAIPGFYAPSGYFVVALEVFTALIVGCGYGWKPSLGPMCWRSRAKPMSGWTDSSGKSRASWPRCRRRAGPVWVPAMGPKAHAGMTGAGDPWPRRWSLAGIAGCWCDAASARPRS